MASGTATGHRKRLRERFLKSRLNGFHDYEVVELLLTYAITRRDVKPIAKAALKRFGSLHKLFEASRAELVTVDGIGENAALLLTLLKPITKEYLGAPPKKRFKVTSSHDAVSVVKVATGLEVGSLCTLYLNTKNEVLYVDEVTHEYGAVLPVKPKSVIEAAIDNNAKSIIFVRRSGGKEVPLKKIEQKEFEVIKSVEAATRLFDITVFDYIVTCNGEHISAREKGYF